MTVAATAHRLRLDLTAGLGTAIIAIPVELVYGLLAVAPLGQAYADHGVRAALWACVLSGLLALFLRHQPGMIHGSRPASGLILGTLAVTLLNDVRIQSTADPAARVFILLLLCTALAGLIHLAFGLLRVGRSLKHVPYPVVSGLVCGTGMLMILAALPMSLGMPSLATTTMEHLRPLSLAVALASLLSCIYLPRLAPRLPAPALALVLATLLHQGLLFALGPHWLGPSSADVGQLLPAYNLWQAVLDQGLSPWLEWISTLLPYALGIATLTSLETLICLSAIENKNHTRLDSDREFKRMGVANFLIGILGGTPATGNLSRVAANLSSGASSPWSAAFYGLGIALVVVLLGQFIHLIPAAAIAGILLFHGISMIQESSRSLLRQSLTLRHQLPRSEFRLLLANLAVLFSVALVAVFSDMMQAIGLGLILSMFLFVRSSMKPVIRQVLSGRDHHSLKVRSNAENALLTDEGDQIRLIELEGTLFFGSIDRLLQEIDKQARTARCIILDLHRVRDADTTSAHKLLQAARGLAARQITLCLCNASQRVERLYRNSGIDDIVLWYADADQALESREDLLLARHGVAGDNRVIRLEQTDLAVDLDAKQVEILKAYLEFSELQEQGYVFRSGDGGSCLFVAREGVVNIMLPMENGPAKRVAAFAPGAIFGEMAMLENKPRSADAVVSRPTGIWQLSLGQLQRLSSEHPAIAQQVMLNVTRCLSARLRHTTRELRQLSRRT